MVEPLWIYSRWAEFGTELLTGGTAIVECKAPEVKITQKTFDQIARYNLKLQVPYLWVSNGKTNFVCHVDLSNQKVHFLETLPIVSILMEGK